MDLIAAVETNARKRVRVANDEDGTIGTWFGVGELVEKYRNGYPMWLIKAKFQSEDDNITFKADWTNGFRNPIFMFAEKDRTKEVDDFLKQLAARKVKTVVTIEVIP